MTDRPDSSSPQPTAGQRVSRYEIREPLGAGGMGVVYLAQDRTLDRPVALKFLSDELQEDATARRRFLREAKAAAALDHPYICKIYETGETDGRPFIAMEYVRGETLADRLARSDGAHDRSLPIDEVLRLASEIAEALETAHGEGLVHRDLKPANIMLTAGGHVKVLDFGLAKRAVSGEGGDAPTASELSEVGTVRGTVAYMSPEQVRGQTVDGRSDIFSFGVVLYELLTGRHPFGKETTLETAAAILNETPAPLTHHRQDAPDLLEHILAKLLAKVPAERCQLAHDVRTDLTRVTVAVERGRLPVVEPSPSLPDRLGAQTRPASRWSVFGRRSLLASAVVTVGLLAGLWAWWTTVPGTIVSDAPPSIAVLPLSNVSADPSESDYLADGITRAVITKLTQVGLRVTPWNTVLRFRDSAQPTDQIAQALNVDTVLLGTFELVGERMLTTLSLVEAESGLQSWADAFEEPYADVFDVQRRIAAGAASSLKLELTGEEETVLATPESTSVQAYDAYLQGADLLLVGDQESTDVAFEYFARAIEIDPTLTEAHVGLGAVYDARFWSGWGGGLRNLDLARSSYEDALRLNPANMRARRGLMSVHFSFGDSEACLRQGQEAARLGRPDDVETLLARGEAFYRGGLHDLALPLLGRVIALDPGNEAAYWWSVLASYAARQSDATLDIGDSHRGRFGDDLFIHSLVAQAQSRLGNLERAREHFELSMQSQMDRSTDPTFATWYSILALVHAGGFYDRMGQRDQMEAVWQRGIELVTSKLETDPDSVGMRLYLASFHGFLGDRTALLREEARALDLTSGSPWELLVLAAAHARLGDADRAVELLREQLRQGRLVELIANIEFLVPALLDAPAFDGFRREYDAREQQLRERYGPTSSGRRETEDTP